MTQKRPYRLLRRPGLPGARIRSLLLLIVGVLGTAPVHAQETPRPVTLSDTLATLNVWDYTWPVHRQDSVVHRLRMAGGGFLVYGFSYTLGAETDVQPQVNWVAAPLKQVRSVVFTVAPHGRDGRPVDQWHEGGETELIVAGPLAASRVPMTGAATFPPLRYGPNVTCIRLSGVLIEYVDGTIRTFADRNLRGILGDAVPNTCRPDGKPVVAAAATSPDPR